MNKNTVTLEYYTYGRQNIQAYEEELARIGIELKNAAQAVMSGADSETLAKAIKEKEQRRRYLEYQIRQIKTTNQEKVFVTPPAIKQKFQRLLEVIQRKRLKH